MRTSIVGMRGGRRVSALLVASTGGHLRELLELRPRLPVDRVAWLTFDGEQARALPPGERVHYLHWTGSRDHRNTARNLGPAAALLRRQRYDLVVSTGAAVALSVFPVARARGLPCHYIESATRTSAPSVTGRALLSLPGVHRYAQYRDWNDRRWDYAGSVFDGFAAEPRERRPIRKVVVMLGTMRQYSFRAAVERLVEILPPDVEVVWQTGFTDVTGLPIEPRAMLPADELQRHVAEADVVVAHAGVGSSLDALTAGHAPVLLPRRASRGEHVDDHQELVARALVERGLACSVEAPALRLADLEAAAAVTVRRVRAPDVELRSG